MSKPMLESWTYTPQAEYIQFTRSQGGYTQVVKIWLRPSHRVMVVGIEPDGTQIGTSVWVDELMEMIDMTKGKQT